MLPLLQAIYAKFTASGALAAAFPGGLHRDQAPETTTLPYVVSQVLESKLEYAYGGAAAARTQIRFSAYGPGHDAAAALMDILVGTFDDALLTLASGTNVAVTRLGDPLPALHKHDAQGNDVWAWSVVYEYLVKQ